MSDPSLPRDFEATSRGYFAYEHLWPSPKIKEQLKCVQEPDNEWDPNAIAIIRNGDIVGHVPAEHLEYVNPFMDRGYKLTATVIGMQVNRGITTGPEIPCIYRFQGKTRKRQEADDQHRKKMKTRHTVDISEESDGSTSEESEEASHLPEEIKKLDPSMANEYIRALQEGKEIPKSIRVMVVGHYGVGKTSLTRNLLGVPLDGIESTDGIDVHKCIASVDGKWESNDDVTKDDTDAMARLASVHSKLQTQETPNTSPDDATENAANEIVYDRNQRTRKECSKNVPKKDVLKFSKLVQQMDKEPKTTINIWDFGGQFIYYSTHHLFHSRKAVYLLVLDATKSLDTKIHDTDFPAETGNAKSVEMFCKFWMNSIHSFAGKQDGEPPVIIVVTHTDKLSGSQANKRKLVNKFVDKVRDLFKEQVFKHIQPKFFLVDNLADDKREINKLGRYIIKVAEKQKSRQEEVPAKWIRLESSLSEKKMDKHITFEELRTIDAANAVPISDEVQIKLFLTFHHQMGNLIYFDKDQLSNCVVLDPQWLIDAFACLVTSKPYCTARSGLRKCWKRFEKKACLYPQLIEEVWRKNKENDYFLNKELIMGFLTQLGIVAKATSFNIATGDKRNLQFYTVPCMLKSDHANRVLVFLKSKVSTLTAFVYKFSLGFVSPTLYHCLTAAAIGKWPILKQDGECLLYERIGVYKLDLQHAGVINMTDDTIEIRVVNMCGRAIACHGSIQLRQFVKTILLQEIRRKQQYKEYIRCNFRNKSGLKLEEVEELRKCKYSKIVCPDAKEGHNLDVKALLAQWFHDEKGLVKRQETKIVDTLKQKTGLSFQQLVTQRDAALIAQSIGGAWELLGLGLGLSDAVIKQIKRDNKFSVNQQSNMIQKWAETEGENAALEVLLREMEDCSLDLTVSWNQIETYCYKYWKIE